MTYSWSKATEKFKVGMPMLSQGKKVPREGQ